jgi:hypothetical protein
LQFLETPRLRPIYSEDGISIWFLEVDGELTLHTTLGKPITKDFISRATHLLDCLCVILQDDYGWTEVNTWIPKDREDLKRWVSYFGFVTTNTFVDFDGQELEVFTLKFPEKVN